jgi:hypothetical protein
VNGLTVQIKEHQMKSQIVTVTLLVLLCGSTVALAQGRGGRGGFGGRGMGRGITEMSLLEVEEVQKELDLVEDQIAKVDTLRESLRESARDARGGDRTNFQDLTEQERDQFIEQRRKEAAENAAKAKAELKNILLDDQIVRLQQIYIQVAGAQALTDADVAAKLGLSEDQLATIETTRREAQQQMFAQMQELGQAGDREAMRTKMNELRKAADEKVLVHLTAEQQTEFASMKGEAFDLPPGALFRGGRGGFGGGERGRFGAGGGPGGDRGERGNRPNRPQRPE